MAFWNRLYLFARDGLCVRAVSRRFVSRDDDAARSYRTADVAGGTYPLRRNHRDRALPPLRRGPKHDGHRRRHNHQYHHHYRRNGNAAAVGQRSHHDDTKSAHTHSSASQITIPNEISFVPPLKNDGENVVQLSAVIANSTNTSSDLDDDDSLVGLHIMQEGDEIREEDHGFDPSRYNRTKDTLVSLTNEQQLPEVQQSMVPDTASLRTYSSSDDDDKTNNNNNGGKHLSLMTFQNEDPLDTDNIVSSHHNICFAVGCHDDSTSSCGSCDDDDVIGSFWYQVASPAGARVSTSHERDRPIKNSPS